MKFGALNDNSCFLRKSNLSLDADELIDTLEKLLSNI
jgi:hypothetical protein